MMEAINRRIDVIRVAGMLGVMNEAKNNLVDTMWSNGHPTLRMSTHYQYSNGHGSITAGSRAYGSFKMIKFLTDYKRDAKNTNISLVLAYTQAVQLPEIINVDYVLKENNMVLSFKNVKIISSQTVDGFKFFNCSTSLDNVRIDRLTAGNMVYPLEVQELREIPHQSASDANISRRLNAVLDSETAPTTESKTEVSTDSIRSKFKKLAQI
jgi:hypothetical protein